MHKMHFCKILVVKCTVRARAEAVAVFVGAAQMFTAFSGNKKMFAQKKMFAYLIWIKKCLLECTRRWYPHSARLRLCLHSLASAKYLSTSGRLRRSPCGIF